MQCRPSINRKLNQRPQGALGFELQIIAYLTEVLCPEIADINCSRLKIPGKLWEEVVKQRNNKTSRELAKDYGVSYEAVRRTVSKSLDF